MKHFHIIKLHPLSSLMIVHLLEVKNDLFCFKEDNEELLSPEVPYYSVISALRYLANYTRPNITLFVNLQDIVLHQLIDIGIKSIMYLITWVYVISKDHNLNLFEYVDVAYLSDPHKTHLK